MSEPEVKVTEMPEGFGDMLKAVLEQKSSEAAAHDAAHMINLLADSVNKLTACGFADPQIKGILQRIDAYTGVMEGSKADTVKH